MATLDCGHEKDALIGYVSIGATGEVLCKPCYSSRKRCAYDPKVLRRERVNLKDCIGFQTLVGTILMDGEEDFPRRRGNCCDILNMLVENVDEALKRWPSLAVDCEVEIVSLRGKERVRVVDERVPRDWRHHVCEVCNVYEE